MADLEPLSGPLEVAYKKVFEMLKKGETQEQWAEKCEGLMLLRRIAVTSPEFLIYDLHVLLLALIAEVCVYLFFLSIYINYLSYVCVLECNEIEN